MAYTDGSGRCSSSSRSRELYFASMSGMSNRLLISCYERFTRESEKRVKLLELVKVAYTWLNTPDCYTFLVAGESERENEHCTDYSAWHLHDSARAAYAQRCKTCGGANRRLASCMCLAGIFAHFCCLTALLATMAD